MIITPLQSQSFFDDKKVISFDTESFRYLDGGIEYQELANYSIYDGIQYFNGKTLNDFLEHVNFLLKKYKKIILSAHNIKYDLANLNLINKIIKNEELLGLQQKIRILGNVNYVKYQSKNRTKSLEFLDSLNYFRTTLEKIGRGLNLEKYATHEDYNLLPDKWNKYIEENGIELCEKDTYILYKLYENMISNKNIIWSISMASSSFRTFLNKYLKYNINLSDFNELCLKGYHGGRVEAYNLNFHKYAYDLDINSLYPYVMINYKYSISFRRKIDNPNPIYLIENIENENYNYLLNIDYEIIGDIERLPIMTTVNGKLIQLKKASGILISGREYLTLFKDLPVKIKINECYEFRNADLFSDFVNYFYGQKSSGNQLFHMFYKGILNSLYGKFGQHKEFTDYIHIDNIQDENLKNILKMSKNKQRINYNGNFYSLYGDYMTVLNKEPPKYAVLIAMEITANARLYNYEIQKKLGFENVLYTDTDSFFVPEMTDNIKNMIGDEIGKLKIEKEGKFRANAPKDYEFFRFDNDKKDWLPEKTLKGIPKKAVKIDENTYEYETIKYIKMRSSHNIIVQKTVKNVNHDNDKMKYDNGIGIIWNDIEEYMNYNKVIINDKNNKR